MTDRKDTNDTTRKPSDYDAGTADKVEKKPQDGGTSPQQKHNDEDHG
jgi:hypothetical protein